ncbi:unnamed protein product [Kuraishia capsulata CBS 1993]|uniref:Major facilitator superfamily (MFS) profile domain-containing protein n=1 Tax=Kuraishia capsulata CBS 1993 TaxID=1382522 RepID=W6MJC7_9ASCO|nr:uncharacterized protein KUCA_T00002034001 [Kuraishia capsulata CBS 1993]CDK26063.1 unnamed protein product [Kuraishia capsulata CBS 1993]
MSSISSKEQTALSKEVFEVKVDEDIADVESHSSYDTTKWYNKGLKVFGYECKAYSQGDIQILMVSFVCFMTVGMYSAVSGLGAGGTLNATVVNNSNVALYATFASLAFFSGSICNKLGVRPLLCFGGWGYGLYVGSLLCFTKTNNGAFVIASGAILGVCAAFLWTAQGTIMLSYAEEGDKGKNIGRFWAIFQAGNVLGCFIPLIQTVNDTGGNELGTASYAAFIALICVGALLATTLLPTKLVRKADGSKVMMKDNPTWLSEFRGLWMCLKLEPWIMLMFPMFWASNWFGTYEGNDFNLVNFNIRTRALNALLFAVMEVFGAVAAGSFLDLRFCSRKTMARVGGGILFLLTMAIWGGGLKPQLGYTRASVAAGELEKMDWTDKKYGGYIVLYMLYGAYDAIWQTYCYWLMGALTNSSRKLAIYTGFYKGLQSAGAAVVWRLDALETSYMAMFASTWGLLAGSLLIASPVVFFKVKEETDEEDDKHFLDL